MQETDRQKYIKMIKKTGVEGQISIDRDIDRLIDEERERQRDCKIQRQIDKQKGRN